MIVILSFERNWNVIKGMRHDHQARAAPREVVRSSSKAELEEDLRLWTHPRTGWSCPNAHRERQHDS